MTAVGLPFRYFARYLRTTARLLFHPGRFFSAMPREGGLVLPLLYAVATHWLASAISFLWKVPVFEIIQNGFREGRGLWSEFAGDLSKIESAGRHAGSPLTTEAAAKFKELVLPWFWGTSSVLLDPFFTIGWTLLTSFLVFLAARVLIDSERPIRFETILRIVCFAGTPILWNVVPVAGAIIAPIAIVATTAVGLMEVHQASLPRSLIAAIFPKIAVFLMLIAGFAAVGWMAFRFLISFFGAS